MKRSNLILIFFVTGVLFYSSNGFSAEEAGKKSVVAVPVALDEKALSSATESQPSGKSISKNGDVAEESEKPVPVASVSLDPKTEKAPSLKKEEEIVAAKASVAGSVQIPGNSPKEAQPLFQSIPRMNE